MNPFLMLFLVLFLLGSGSLAMAVVFLQTADPTAAGELPYCWWC